MSNQLQTQQPSEPLASAIEQVLIAGDLSKLNPEDRLALYKATCSSLGLNPLTKPFDYINLNGKLTLYARKDCTEQLRTIHSISIDILSRDVIDGVYVVTARAQNAVGRHDESTGAVAIENLKGESKANAMMKAETKAKRRVTLSICGLGILDESEIETIEGARYESNFLVEPKSQPESTSEVRRKNPEKAKEEGQSQPSPVVAELPNTRKGTTSDQSLRQRLLAEKERLLTDLGIPREKRKEILDKYFRGFLELGLTDPMPTKPLEPFMDSLQALDVMTLHDRDAMREHMLARPLETGQDALALHSKAVVAETEYGWPQEARMLTMRVLLQFGYSTLDELTEYMTANSVAPIQYHDAMAFMRLALFDRGLASEAASEAETAAIGIAFILEGVEERLRAQLETSTPARAKEALLAKDFSTANTTATAT